MINLSEYKDILLNLGLREIAIPRLQEYLTLLWKANETLNLVSRKMTKKELILNHVVDCLLPLKHFPRATTTTTTTVTTTATTTAAATTTVKRVADFGSGGGLPGVLYAIQFPSIQFHLFEKSPKKQIFLNECRFIAPNIVVNGEIKDKDLQGIDLVISRAFKPIDEILAVSRSYYESGGAYFLLKGRLEKINEELNLVGKAKLASVEVTPLVSPVLEVERHLVRINLPHSI